MIPPVENHTAAFPPARRAGNVELGPLTIAGAIRLGAEGVDCGAPVPEAALARAAFVLSGEADWLRFIRRARFGLRELSAAVEAALDDAFSTWVRPEPPEGAARSLTPSGPGWTLELAEWLCAEYGWGWREALETPVCTAFALAAACRHRLGLRHAGLDYGQRRYAADLKAGRAAPVRLDPPGGRAVEWGHG